MVGSQTAGKAGGHAAVENRGRQASGGGRLQGGRKGGGQVQAQRDRQHGGGAAHGNKE